jgi:signal transduction histidine kinase
MDPDAIDRFRQICAVHDKYGTEEASTILKHLRCCSNQRSHNDNDNDQQHQKRSYSPHLSEDNIKHLLLPYDSNSMSESNNDSSHPHDSKPILNEMIHTQYVQHPTAAIQRIKELEERCAELENHLYISRMTQASFTEALTLLAQSASESLKRERDIHHQILSVLPVGVFCGETWLEEQVFVNKMFCQLVGRSEEEVRSGKWIDAVHPDDRQSVEELLMNKKQISEEPVKLEYRVRVNAIETGGLPMTDANGAGKLNDGDGVTNGVEEKLVWMASETLKCNIQGRWVFLHAVVDTTDVKRLSVEHTLSEAREAYQMQKATEADKRRLLLDEFIDGLCHELRNPLNGIVGNIDALQSSLDARRDILHTIGNRTQSAMMDSNSEMVTLSKNDFQTLYEQIEDDEASIATINTCAIHSRVLADDVLSLSKIDSNMMVLRNEPFCPKKLLVEVAKIMGPKASAKGIDVRFNVPYNNSQFIGDAFRIRQVIINLFSNAIVYTEKGSITLEVDYCHQPPTAKVAGFQDGGHSNLTAAAQHFETSTTPGSPLKRSKSLIFTCPGGRSSSSKSPPRYLRISVVDTGVGMTEEEKSRLFQKFSQPTVAISRDQQYEGSGLGLVISKKLVELMGGWIEIQSEKGVGSRFSFTIKEVPEKVGGDAGSGRSGKSKPSSVVGMDGSPRVFGFDAAPLPGCRSPRLRNDAAVELTPTLPATKRQLPMNTPEDLKVLGNVPDSTYNSVLVVEDNLIK